METFPNNDFSLFQDEGATFGEYRTTTKVNGVQSQFTPDIDAIPSAEDKYDRYEKTTFEIGPESSPLDVEYLESNNVGAEEAAQFGEYRTMTKVNGVQSIYTPSIDAKPSYEDILGVNDLTTSTPIIDANISESKPFVDTTSTLNNYNFTSSDTNINQEANQNNDFQDINLNDNQANEAINDIKQNVQVYNGVLHQSIEPVVDSNDSPILDFNINNYQKDKIVDTYNDDNHIIDTANLPDDYQNVEPTPIIDIDSATQNYQNTETSPIVDTTITTGENTAYNDISGIDTQLNDEIINKYRTSEPFDTTTKTMNQVIETTTTTNLNQVQDKSPIIEDLNSIYSTNPMQIASSDRTYNLKDYTEINNKLDNAGISTTNTDFADIQTTDNFDYEAVLKELPKPSQKIVPPKKEIIQEPIKTTPVQYTTYGPTTSLTKVESYIKPKEVAKAELTNINTSNYIQKAPATTIKQIIKPPEITTPLPNIQTTTVTTKTTPARYTTYSQKTVNKPPEIPKTKPTTITTSPVQYTINSEAAPLTTFESINKPTTITTTPAEYTTYSQISPLTTFESITKPTPITTTPVQYTINSQVTPVSKFESINKPTTTTTTLPAYTTYSQVSPLTTFESIIDPTQIQNTQSTTVTTTTTPTQYTTYSQTIPMPIKSTSSIAMPPVEQIPRIETLYTPASAVSQRVIPQNISVVPQPLLISKPQPLTVKVPKIQKVFVPKIQKVYVPSNKKVYVRRPSATGSIITPTTASRLPILTAMPGTSSVVPMTLRSQVIPTPQNALINSVPITNSITTVKPTLSTIPQRSYIAPANPPINPVPTTYSIASVRPPVVAAPLNNSLLITPQSRLVNVPYNQYSQSSVRIPQYSQGSVRITQPGLVNVPYSQYSQSSVRIPQYSQGSVRIPQPGLVNVPYSQYSQTSVRIPQYSQGSVRIPQPALVNVPYSQGSVIVPQSVPYSIASIPVVQPNLGNVYNQKSIPVANIPQTTIPGVGMKRPTVYNTSTNRSYHRRNSSRNSSRNNLLEAFAPATQKYSTRTYNARRL